MRKNDKMMNKIEQLKLSEDGFTLIEMMIVVAIIAIFDSNSPTEI